MPRLSPRTRLAKRTKQYARARLGGDITPMIDVVFLLLIFFICTMDFKKLESKLTAHLPTEKGQNENYEDLEPIEEMRIHLSMNGERCYCRVNGKSIGTLPARRSTIYERVDALRRVQPKSPAIISVDPTVPHEHVVAVVDECTRAEVAEITFAAALPDLRRR